MLLSCFCRVKYQEKSCETIDMGIKIESNPQSWRFFSQQMLGTTTQGQNAAAMGDFVRQTRRKKKIEYNIPHYPLKKKNTYHIFT